MGEILLLITPERNINTKETEQEAAKRGILFLIGNIPTIAFPLTKERMGQTLSTYFRRVFV